MRSFSKKLACVLAAGAMVVTMFPAAKAQAADEFALNRTSQILYVNEGASYNKQSYDFNFKKAPAGYLSDYSFAWATDKAEVATVKAGGVVTAVGVGKAKISCAVTKKGTTDVVATVTANVEVKANAKTVTVTNAAEYDGQVFEAGNVVDLNRSMTDYFGNQTNKRGKFVTDFTRWMAEPATGVEINQTNGQFTFTDEAEGEYELYCETYQSAAHPEATAKSASVKVTVNNKASFAVKQLTEKKFSVTFDKATKATLNDVTVNRLFKTAADTYKYPQVVKDLQLAEDGKSAMIELFSAMADGVEYELKLTGFDPITFKASVGAPASMTLSMNAEKADPFVTADSAEHTIFARFFDANGVELTGVDKSRVVMTLKEYSQDGSYYLAGDEICFTAPELQCTVVAEYMTGEYDENGNAIGNVSTEFTFISQAVAAAPVFANVSDATLYTGTYTDGVFKKKSLDVTFGDEAMLAIKVKDSAGTEYYITKNKQQVMDNKGNLLGIVSFEEVTPNVAALNKSGESLKVISFTEGQATFVVNLQKDEQSAVVPVGAVTITVKPARALATVTASKTNVTVSTESGFDHDTITFTGKDQYGAAYPVGEIQLEGVGANPGTQKYVGNGVAATGGAIEIYGSKLAANGAVSGEQKAVQLAFVAKVGGKSINFTVLVKAPVGNTQVVLEVSDGAFGDISRKEFTEDELPEIKVTAFTMSNGIKNGYQVISGAVKETYGEEDEGKYFAKVTRNGKALAGNEWYIDGANIIFKIADYSDLDRTIDYSAGVGSYVVSLVKVQKNSGKYIGVPQNTLNGSVSANAMGTYTYVKKKAESVEDLSVLWYDITDVFEFKDAMGQTVDLSTGNIDYYVELNEDATDYVYVKNVTFYEMIGDFYAEYKVNVNQYLKR